METLKGETVLNGEQSVLLKFFFPYNNVTEKLEQESQSIAFIKECKNRRRKPNKGQTA